MDVDTCVKNGTILVQIPAYKDPELIDTVQGALLQADNPDRVHFAICYQNNDKSGLFVLQKIPNCVIIDIDEPDARGSCYARYLCQKVLHNEDYIMHIDSHLRFVKHWDSALIRQLHSYNDHKAIISTYTDDYQFESIRSLSLTDPFFDKPTGGHFRYITAVRDSCFYSVEHRLYKDFDEYEKFGKCCVLVAGGYFFSFADVDRVVLYDPDMVFQGDEIAYGLRLFTYGYNIYSPYENYVWHHYERPNRYFPDVKNGYDVESSRFKYLLGLSTDLPDSKYDIRDFGLGSVRTVEEYEVAVGICFRERLLSRNAVNGDFRHNKDSLSYDYPASFLIDKGFCFGNIVVCIMWDGSGDLFALIHDYEQRSVYKDRLKFVVYGNRIPSNIVIESVEYGNIIVVNADFDVDENACFYGNAYFQFARYVGYDDYVLCIKSCVVPVDEWDKRLILDHVFLGDNAVVTAGLCSIRSDAIRAAYAPFSLRLSSFCGYFFDIKNGDPVRDVSLSPFINSDIVFGKGKFLYDVSSDTNMSGIAFETTYSVRLWLHGYDIYIPSAIYFCNCGSFDAKWLSGQKYELYQVNAVIDLFRYGFDRSLDRKINIVRNISLYCKVAGIDYKAKLISERAFYGVNFGLGSLNKNKWFDRYKLPDWSATHKAYISSVSG